MTTRTIAFSILFTSLGAQQPIAIAQTSFQAQPADAVKTSSSPPTLAKRTVDFSNPIPVLGLPLNGSTPKSHCSPNGLTFVDVPTSTAGQDEAGVPDLYRVDIDGHAMLLRRKLPPAFTEISVVDTFTADQKIYTLLRATGAKDEQNATQPKEIRYFISSSDDEGDMANLIQLDTDFRPLRIGTFGSGDLAVLGWDEANLLPQLALLKDDGSIRRFLDYSRPASKHSSISGSAQQPAPEPITLESLQGAVFVPYGRALLLTFPGTRRGIRVLSESGSWRNIPLALPSDLTLHDVLPSNGSGMLLVRTQPNTGTESAVANGKKEEPEERLFEVSPYLGSALHEIVFDHPRANDVTCAAKSSIIAIYYETTAPTSNSSTAPTSNTQQLVIASTPK